MNNTTNITTKDMQAAIDVYHHTVDQLLDRYVYAIDGNKIIDKHSASTVAIMKVSEFRMLTSNLCKTPKGYSPPAKAFFESPNRPTVRGVCREYGNHDQIIKRDGCDWYNLEFDDPVNHRPY